MVTQRPMMYEPREDSYLLQKYVRQFAHGRVLDVGTGSGIQAKTALEKTNEVIAIDIDPEAVAHAKKQGIRAIISDLFEQVEGTFDLIIFNAPYLPAMKGEQPEIARQVAGGKKGNEIIERFLKDASAYLKPQGKILLVCSSLTPDFESLCKKYKWKQKLLEEEACFFEKLLVYLIEKH